MGTPPPHPRVNHPAKGEGKAAHTHTYTHKSSNRPPAVPDCNQLLSRPALPDSAMTNSRRFRRSCSLRVAKSPGLLDYTSGSFYNHLEEADPTKGPRGTVAGQSGPIPCTGESQKISAQSKGSWRRATSLRVRKVTGEETVTMGEAAHSLGHDDGQLLIGEAHGKSGSKMKKCKQVRASVGPRCH